MSLQKMIKLELPCLHIMFFYFQAISHLILVIIWIQELTCDARCYWSFALTHQHSEYIFHHLGKISITDLFMAEEFTYG